MQNRREVPRYMCELPARLSLPDGETIANLTLIRLGIWGCASRGEGVPAVGQKARLLVEWQGRQFQADAGVVWKTKDGLAGFKFAPVDEKDKEILMKICANLPMQPLTQPAIKPASKDKLE